MEAYRAHCMKFEVDCLRDPEMLDVPQLCCHRIPVQGELITGSGTKPRERSVL